MKRAIVNPMPATTPTTNIWAQPTPDRSAAIPARTAIKERPTTPSGLPSTSPAATPRVAEDGLGSGRPFEPANRRKRAKSDCLQIRCSRYAHLVRGVLLEELGRRAEAIAALDHAKAGARNAAESAQIAPRLHRLG
jgi:hypothetical protein